MTNTDPEELDRVIRTLAYGPFYLSQLVLPAMRREARGDIVMISSTEATAFNTNGSPYRMGKAAMEALAFTLAKEERTNGIRVNIVAPGLVKTDMTAKAPSIHGVETWEELGPHAPFGRVCEPRDIAHMVHFLVSDEAAYVTGQRITVDGGGMRLKR